MPSPAEYRIRLSQLIVPAQVALPTPSLCYPDRHRRSDRQILVTTARYMAVMLIGVAIAVAVSLGVR